MSFWNFRQNNSGGSFVFDAVRGISVNVIVEADSADEAIARAEQIGVYFDGCAAGYDCTCCGDRWYRPWSDEGTEAPKIYDEDVSNGVYRDRYGWSDDGIEGYIHYRDGRVVPVRIQETREDSV